MDENSNSYILTINAGSSSIKLALFTLNDTLKQSFEAAIENIGQPSATLQISGEAGSNDTPGSVAAPDHQAAAEVLIEWLKQHVPIDAVSAIGHRIVHGGPKYFEPCIINDELLKDLDELTIFDPEHLPIEIKLIETFQRLLPNCQQVACFDTAFHHDLPSMARLLPIPRQYEAKGIRRYGFHGLSYTFVLKEVRRLDGDDAANGRLVLAHLGNGVSLAAVRGGKSIDTTMGLTPASGVPMSTRSGDLDPGLALYLAKSEDMDAAQFNDLVNFRSGLLGISETTADMHALLEHEAEDQRAKETIDLFCYQVKKSIGAYSAALGGLDWLVFTGGMGENAPRIRARICEGLEFLGITIDESRNNGNESVISADGSKVAVRVIHADEAATIAQNVWHIVSEKDVT